MQRTAPNRMALLSLTRQRDFARKGASLLRTKREALMRELLALGRPLVECHTALSRAAREAARSLLMARGLDGRHRVLSASFGARLPADVTVKEGRVWGVPVPTVHVSPAQAEERIAPEALSARIREARADAEVVAEHLLALLPLELRLRRLGPEVRRTSRRINALEHLLIPGLERDIATIDRALEELEREDRFRLQRIKGKKSRG